MHLCQIQLLFGDLAMFLKIKEHDGLKRRNNGTITILYFMCVLPEGLSFSLLK